MYDAVIVGAGPAGAYLGYLLARAGRRVAIIDKARFPRDKVCGGGISAKTADLLNVDITPVIHRAIDGAYITYQNQRVVDTVLPGVAGYTVVRREFDALLLERATQAGADFMPGTGFESVEQGPALKVVTSQGVLSGRWLFGADGVGSRVRKQVFGDGLIRYAPAVETFIHVPEAAMAPFQRRVLFDLGGMARGYGWIFPKRDHLNVGVYSPFGADDIKGQLRAFIRRYPGLGAEAGRPCVGYAIPVGNRGHRYESGNVWLLGDAAGLAEGLFGEGIYFAVKSACLAYETLQRHDFCPPVGSYSRQIVTHLGGELASARSLGRLVYGLPRLAFHRLARNGRASRRFAQLMTHAGGYRRCLYGTAATAPYWLLGLGRRATMDPVI